MRSSGASSPASWLKEFSEDTETISWEESLADISKSAPNAEKTIEAIKILQASKLERASTDEKRKSILAKSAQEIDDTIKIRNFNSIQQLAATIRKSPVYQGICNDPSIDDKATYYYNYILNNAKESLEDNPHSEKHKKIILLNGRGILEPTIKRAFENLRCQTIQDASQGKML